MPFENLGWGVEYCIGNGDMPCGIGDSKISTSVVVVV